MEKHIEVSNQNALTMIHFYKIVISLLLFCPLTIMSQVSTGTTVPKDNFHVHDSISTSGILISAGNFTPIGLHLERTILNEGNIYNDGGRLKLKSGPLVGVGGELVLFEGGNVGIGLGLLSADVSNALTVAGSNPLKLMGLNTSSTLDTILVKNNAGVIYERPFKSMFEANTYWTKSSNYLSSLDSIGIGTASPAAPLHVKNTENLDVILTSDKNETGLHLQANGVESVIGQYDMTSTKMLLEGTLPAKGLSFFEGKFESISVDQTQGMLLNISNEKPIYFANAGAERMRIHDDGNVHVGPFDPSSNSILNIHGSTTLKDSLFFNDPDYYLAKKNDTLNIISDKHMRFRARRIGDYSFENHDSTFVHFDGSRASVGIGIENAIQELEVNGDVLVYDTLYIGNRFSKLYTGANTYFSTLTNMNLQARANYDIKIRSDDVEYATFDGKTRNFGVGTTTPEEKIDVIGVVKADSFKMVTSPETGHVMTSDADGFATWQEIPNDNDWNKVGLDLYTSSAGSVTIGTGGTPTSLFNIHGSISLPITSTAATIYTPAAVDHTVILTTPSSSVILPLSLAKGGRIYVLKFLVGGGPSSIQCSGADMIDGSPSFTVPASPIGGIYTTIVVQSDGATGWWIINY